MPASRGRPSTTIRRWSRTGGRRTCSPRASGRGAASAARFSASIARSPESVTRLPLPYGSRLAVVDAGEDAVVLAPPPPVKPIADIAAAVRDALRFPLAGQPLEALVTRGSRATIVVEPPALPIPGSPSDPRRTAIAATMIELDRAGASLRDQTLLVAGGLARKAGHHELELLVHPEFARRFHGRVEVHDAESPDLVEVIGPGGRAFPVN